MNKKNNWSRIERMKKTLLILIFFILLTTSIGEGIYIWHQQNGFNALLTLLQQKPPARRTPLLAYDFQNLRKTKFPVTQINLGNVVTSTSTYISRIFYYSVPVKPNSNKLEKVSGLMNLPVKPGNYPVIVMFRGYVDQNIYKPGIGTQPVAQVLAQNGYITLAPDFLGYGQSASPSADPFENRFQTYTTALTMLSSLPTLNKGLNSVYDGTMSADLTKVGIWAHSNGGHIALSILAISGVTYPTVLWAPVSTSFPYDILYYTDESDDQGKGLRKVLATFEKVYNTDLFSPPRYYKWIKAPIELDQGTNDHEVPFWWSDQLDATLTKDKVDITYNTYPGADHNMLPNGWPNAVSNDLQFYAKEFSK